MKDFARKFYNSKAWRNCRQSYISERRMIDGGMCEICGERMGFIVHHKEKLTASNINNPDITLNHANLQYVCKSCHDEIDEHFISRKKSLCIFTADGQPIDRRRTAH